MPISHLLRSFAGIVTSNPQVIVEKPRWIFAQTCEVRNRENATERSTALLVCRSPLVHDTKSWYRPVADLILSAGRVDTLYSERIPAPEMMHKVCSFELYSLSAADFVCTYDHSPELIRQKIEEAIAGQGDMVFD